jgi:hypothetical protein
VSDEPKTLAEQLDAAKNAEEFGNVLMGFFAAEDKARYGDE